ncbi:uncharacterized protein LOC141665009 [Apium graveolens]|uniref:uncharacterized protein LOC141665009 n=1 Tax=Apium graveolens TaxID=4045 RepID=UPI003D7AC180
MTGFTETIRDCGLIDLDFVGERTVTWGLANQEWGSLFPTAEIQVPNVAPSDHLPLHLQLNKRVYVPKERRFRFENVWVKEKECLNLVKQSWESTEGEELIDKIKYCCMKLEEWGGGVSTEYKRKILICKERLSKFMSRRDVQGIQKYNEARWEYLNLLEKQEIYWKQCAKQFWLREGDQNTRFFHKYASIRRKNNQLARIKGDDGNWKETKEEI